MEKDDAKTDLDEAVNEFLTYDEYLDSKITPSDLYYLEDEKLARQVVELGLRGTGEVWKREEFESRKAAAQPSRLSKRSEQKTLASTGKELKDNFLRALAEREEANRSGKNHKQHTSAHLVSLLHLLHKSYCVKSLPSQISPPPLSKRNT